MLMYLTRGFPSSELRGILFDVRNMDLVVVNDMAAGPVESAQCFT